MSEILSKIENFLFDLLGLVLPGIILILLIFSPLYYLHILDIVLIHNNYSFIFNFLSDVRIFIESKIKGNEKFIIVGFIIAGYIIGHLIKVFSIIMYEFLVVIFDRLFIRLTLIIFQVLKKGLNGTYKFFTNKNIYTTKIYLLLKVISNPIFKTLNKLFVCRPPDYVEDNKPLLDKCVNLINERLGMDYPKEWYSIFKISTILNNQENVISLSKNFLAKYNLYRSLSFLFAFSIIYNYLFFNATSIYSTLYYKLPLLIIIVYIFLWFTFHYKYKRYWTLCGNENLISLFYLLNKNKIHGN